MQRILPHNLILDLDEVLLHHPSEKLENEHRFFLENKGFLAKDSYGNHYIVPAYLSEFLHFATSHFNVHFFSGGDKERNRSVIEHIWEHVFNASKPEHIQVLSRDDLIDAADHRELQPEYDGVYWFGSYKKDITKIGALSATILVDDDQSWVLRSQKSNFLKAPGYLSSYLFEKGEKIENQALEDEDILEDLLVFYKLLYITGILDKASHYKSSIIEGLYAIQYENNQPKFYDRIKEIDYYQRGYKVLSEFLKETLPSYFFTIESHFFQELKKPLNNKQQLQL